MVLDIILIVLFVLMILYGYKKGCIGIVAKLVSLIIAFVLAYLLADTVGSYVSGTSVGTKIQASIENVVIGEINNSEDTTVIQLIQEKLNLKNESDIIQKLADYVFLGIGFVIVFIIARLVLWIAQKILESIFELPVLKTFNKLGGIIASVVLFLIEISIFLAVIKSISTISFMTSIVNTINTSVITKALYDHNIFTMLILNKII